MDSQFKSDVNPPSGQKTGTTVRMKEQVGDKAVQAKDAVADFGRRTIDSLDAQRDSAAASLAHTASALHQQADKVAGVAHATADKLQETADYVGEHDVRAMATDVGDLVRRYPGRALAAAAVMGFLLAWVVRRGSEGAST